MLKRKSAVDARAGGIMTVLCLVWGLQQVAIKAVADEISPVLQVALRSCLAAVLVWVLMRFKLTPFRLTRQQSLPGLAAGLFFALEYLFVAEGLHYTSAAHMAVFLYTAPVFSAIGLQFFAPSERLSLTQWAGIAVAFTGIIVAFSAGDNVRTEISGKVLLGDGLGLLAGLSWGATTVLVRCSSLNQAPAEHTLFYQLAGAGVLLALFSAFSGQYTFSPGMAGSFSLIFQTLVIGFASFFIWFSLLRFYPASQLGVLSFMTPVFGVLAGVVLLDEKLQPAFIWGSILIITGIVIVSVYAWAGQKKIHS